MKLYNQILADLPDLETQLLNTSGRYQIGIAKEFSLLELITGHLFNVCPYDFPQPTANIDLRHLFNPVRDQGNEGSCTEFAGCALREALWNIKNGSLCAVLSPADLYWNARDYPIITKWIENQDTGATARRVISVLTNKGVCPETDMFYVPGQLLSVPPTVTAQLDQVKYKIGKTWRVVPYDVDMVLGVLGSGRPILITLTVWSSFESGGTNGLLTIPDTTKESYLGNHCMVVVGADLVKKQWIVRNSWGVNWGDQGYCYQPFGYEQFWLAGWSGEPS